MFSRILVIGATGLLGRPVVNRLTEGGYSVRILTRNAEKAHTMFGDKVEIAEGSATNIDDVRLAMGGVASCTSISRRQRSTPLRATSSRSHRADSIASATSPRRRSAKRIDGSTESTEDARRAARAGQRPPVRDFCPTWVMETLQNFIRGDKWAIVVDGKNPPPLHFFAAADFGRMVAASYEDDRALGKRL